MIIAASNAAFAQTKITNVKSDKHVHVAGTKVFLIPPEGFESAATFQGFQHIEFGASILVAEIPGPYDEVTQGFTIQGLNSKGMILRKREDFIINGYDGFLLTTEQTANDITYTKYILAFGDPSITYIINGMFPKNGTDLSGVIQKSMLSVVYESKLTIDPLGDVSFSIDTKNTKLKFAKNVTNTLVYTVDGKVPTKSDDKTTLIVGQLLGTILITDKKPMAIERIRKMSIDDLTFDENGVREITIDGISGYEIIAHGISRTLGVKELVYQVMLFTDNGYYIFLGTASSDFEKNLELFRNITQTFKRK